MLYQTINLRDHFPMLPDLGGKPMLTAYCRDNSPEIEENRRHPAILILPGGGYTFTSDREAEPIALKYLEAGFNAFVLRYSVKPARYPDALLQAAAATAYIRTTAAATHTDPGRVSVIGFSAGGHLAGCLSNFWGEDLISQTLRVEKETARPDAVILSYPVITTGLKSHYGSADALCGGDAGLRAKMSLETAVNPGTPPTFVWHTAADTAVPVENSLMYGAALQQAGIPFELHIFGKGAHGLSTCGYDSARPAEGKNPMIEPAAAKWFELSVTWLKDTLGLSW